MDRKKITKPIIPHPYEALGAALQLQVLSYFVPNEAEATKNGMWAGKLKEQTTNVIAGQFEPCGDIPGNGGESNVFSSATNIGEIGYCSRHSG